MSSTGGRQQGTVVKWLNFKGIGFIAPDGQDPSSAGEKNDILVHYSHIKQGNDSFKSLNEGSRVEYDTKPDPKNPSSKLIAVNVTAIGGGDCERRARRTWGNQDQPSLYDLEEENSGDMLYIYSDWKSMTKTNNNGGGGRNRSNHITWRDLKDHFAQHNVKRADLIVAKGYGVVKFASSDNAQEAMKQFNDTELYGQKLKIQTSSSK